MLTRKQDCLFSWTPQDQPWPADPNLLAFASSTCFNETHKPGIVDQLTDLLGEDVLLIPCRLGTKRPTDKEWQKQNAQKMSDPNYRDRLEQGNIGVALGGQSNGLCTLDFDDQQALKTFFQLNPLLRDTLRTKADRGCNLWVKIVGEYPKNQKLKAEGKDIGEWRATGHQTVIHGKHPKGMDYRILNKVRPMEISYSQIHWPENWNMAQHAQSVDYQSFGTIPSGSIKPINTIEEAVLICLPKHESQNHRSLFQLNRALLNVTHNQGFELTVKQKREAFEKWYADNPYLNPKNTKSDYREEFYEAMADARKPISEEVLKDAWEKAHTLDLPNEHEMSEDVFLLQKLCHQLQTLRGQQPFFLGTQTLCTLFNRFSKTHWHRKLKSLKGCGVICEISTGSIKTHKASEFVYLSHPVWTETEEARNILEQLMQPQE
jgi:hypothetical protein